MYAYGDFTTVRDGEVSDFFHEQTHSESSFFADGVQNGNNCVICNQPAHGIHFGVVACRACAAFFRRTIVQGKKYRCRSDTGNCDCTIEERYLCRLCRFQKCIREGMTEHNVRFDPEAQRESYKTPKKVKRRPMPRPDDQPTDLEQLEHSSTDASGQSSSDDVSCLNDQLKKGLYFMKVVSPPDSKKKILDMSIASHSIQEIFGKLTPKFDYDMPLTALQRQIVAMKYFRRNQKRPPMEVTVLDYEAMAPEWMNSLERTAEWMCHCAEFINLPMKEKLIIFRSSWFALQRLEAIELSLELFGEQVFTRKKMAVFDKHYMSDRTISSIPGVFSDKDGYQYRAMEIPFEERLITIARHVQSLQPSVTEMAYMLSQLMWHVEGSACSETTERVADEFRERISHELHDYYIHTEHRSSYAGRLMDLMTIIYNIENLLQERAKAQEVSRLFDVANHEFTNAEDIIDLKVGY